MNTDDERREDDSPPNQDPEWEQWDDDEESNSRRLGRTIPGWLPIAVIAVLVVLGGLWWGLTSGTPAPPPTATRPRVVSTLPATTGTVVAKTTVSQPGGTSNTPVAGATLAVPPASQAGTIAVGKQVKVTGTGVEGISLRFGGGLNYARAATLTEGTLLTVLDKPANLTEAYPIKQDGFVWWRVQTANGTIGWVADNWLRLANP